MKIETFRDITLYPLKDAETGPAEFPYSGEIDQQSFGHFRQGPKRLRNMVEMTRLADGAVAKRHYRKAIFGGYLFSAYGHFLAESIHRLWPLFDNAAHGDLPIIFQSYPRYKERVSALLPFQEDILRYLRIDPARVLLVNEAVHIDELQVPEQTKWLKDPHIDRGYLELFKRFGSSARSATGGNLYLSRSGYMFSGSLLGESLVERVLAEAGIPVVRPEERRFADLIELCGSASRIAMVEGSVLHSMEIAGGLDARLLILSRREKDAFEKQFAHALSQFAGGYEVLARDRVLPPLEATVPARSPIVSDVAAFLRRLQDFYATPLRMPGEAEIGEAMLFDLARCMLDSRATALASDEEIGAQFVKLRNSVKELRLFGDLVR